MNIRTTRVALVLLTVVASSAPWRVSGWDRGRTRIFATLPPGASGPEGLEVDAEGRVYVTTFGFNAAGPVSGLGQLYVYGEDGRLLRNVSVAGSSPHLLGLRFHPVTGSLLVVDFGSAQVLDVDPKTGNSSVFMTLPSPLPHPTLGAGLNDVTFDHAGNVYVSDSFQGIVWKTSQRGGVGSVWVDSSLLRTTGVPPFGANGLRFDKRETAMFVANTGDDTIVKVPTVAGPPDSSGPDAGTPAVFTNSINGADGLLIDHDDNLWIVANQADELVVVDPTGKAVSKLGDFGGLHDGSPVQMLFPASLRFWRGDLLVTNLSLDLRLFDPSFAAVDSEWCAQVSRYTVVKIHARVRGFGEMSESHGDVER
jgi:SMP-30/Gluconolactonase/LRE-like region/Strictosidine synthase-like, N-terminal